MKRGWGFVCSLLAALPIFLVIPALGQTSTWVFFGDDHHLHYNQDTSGNRIMDFSFAGYQGGGVALPNVSAQVTLNPSGADDTAAIQSAIDTVSGIPLDAHGFRGAVQLAAGNFNVSDTLNITASGVVLRGSGAGADGTVIHMTGDPFLLLRIGGAGSAQNVSSSVALTDSYVPSGAMSFNVADASGFQPGDTVLIRRLVSADWIHFMGMDTLVRSGQPQTWISAGSTITTDRVVTAVNGNQVTLDVSLSDNLDLTHATSASIVKYTFPGRISQVGVEGFSAVAVPKNVDITLPQYQGLSMSAVIDSWVRDVTFVDTQNTTTFSGSVKRMTIDNVAVNHTAAHTGDGPADFAFSGTQILVNKCSVNGINNGVWPAVTQSRVTGPVVLLNFHADDRGFAPHQRWATGLLCDQCSFLNSRTSDKAGIAYSDRGILGSGQGWDAGWSVAWNVTAKTFTVQQPPGSQNFCIGCIGTSPTAILTQPEPGKTTPLLPNGIYDSYGTQVSPSSLYLEQLFERKGSQAVIDIGYLDYLKSIDSVAPVSTAAVSPNPNGNGWNNSNVTVTLSATDNAGGTGVQQITYSASGGQNIASTNVSGASASVPITSEGITTVTFFATDFAGNAESAKTVVVRLDKTPPTITCTPTPNVLWPPNHHLVPVSVSVDVADSLSGSNGFNLASVTSNEPDSGDGNIQGFTTSTAATSGSLRAERLGTGTARVYSFNYSATDRAGNSATCGTNVVVPHDQGQ
jgi:hypothetical protein